MVRTTSPICSRRRAGGLITTSTPSPSTLSSKSVTKAATSISASFSVSSPVISQSIHTSLSFTPPPYVLSTSPRSAAKPSSLVIGQRRQPDPDGARIDPELVGQLVASRWSTPARRPVDRTGSAAERRSWRRRAPREASGGASPGRARDGRARGRACTSARPGAGSRLERDDAGREVDLPRRPRGSSLDHDADRPDVVERLPRVVVLHARHRIAGFGQRCPVLVAAILESSSLVPATSTQLVAAPGSADRRLVMRRVQSSEQDLAQRRAEHRVVREGLGGDSVRCSCRTCGYPMDSSAAAATRSGGTPRPAASDSIALIPIEVSGSLRSDSTRERDSRRPAASAFAEMSA